MIDYRAEARKYRPDVIKTLLVGEAPPASGKTYFYIPFVWNVQRLIEEDTSLPATIFFHYFQKRPTAVEEYKVYLEKLTQMGIFMVDIYDNPLKVRNNDVNKQIIKENITKLKAKLVELKIRVVEENMIFLLPRGGYKKIITRYFPAAKAIRWKDFRLNPANSSL